MSKPGEDLEKIVAIIEKSISPESRIEHNVYLPVLTSQIGRTRQCDIIIRTGAPHRETISIVEVQDRNSAVDISDFNNWLTKLVEVGAQHLICVSRKPFPESVKEVAIQNGSRVLLININEIPPTDIPINFINFIFKLNSKKIKEIISIKPFVKPGQIKAEGLKPETRKGHERIWSLDGVSRISINDICLEILKENNQFNNEPNGLIEGTTKYSFINEGKLFYINNEKFIPIGLDIEFSWIYESYEKPMSMASYEQYGHGPMAWIFEVSHKSKNGEFSIKLPVIKIDNDNFEILETIINKPSGYMFDIIPAQNQTTQS